MELKIESCEHSHRISDWDEFRASQIYGDKSLAQMAQLWQGDISKHTMSRALAHIRLTRKKTRLVKLAGERERFELSYLEHGIKA
jgi:hypothetical protein